MASKDLPRIGGLKGGFVLGFITFARRMIRMKQKNSPNSKGDETSLQYLLQSADLLVGINPIRARPNNAQN